MEELWPGWEIVEGIGTGGFSKVYKIRKKDAGDERDYYSALKIITIPQSADEYDSYAQEGYDDDTITGIFTSQVKKIVEEFRLMAQFKGNSNIVSYEDHMIVPHEDGKGWDILIRMELLTSLPKYCIHNVMTTEEIVKLGIDICRALELCKKKNIIHRDIKPQNIFLNEFGDYKLGDFGIAKSMDNATHATKTGTPTYMAPEVYRGEIYNASIDIYSLGLVLYWLLNERRMPFLPLPPEAPTAAQLNESLARRLSGEALPAPKNGSEQLKAIVLKACAFDAADRYETPTAMRRELEKVLDALETADSDAAAGVSAGAAVNYYGLNVVQPGADPDATQVLSGAEPALTGAIAQNENAPIPDEEPAIEATVGLFGGRMAQQPMEAMTEMQNIPEPEPEPEPEPVPEEPYIPAEEASAKKSGKGKSLAIVGGILAALIIVVILLLLRGCGDTADDGNTDDRDRGDRTETSDVGALVTPEKTTTGRTDTTTEPTTAPATTEATTAPQSTTTAPVSETTAAPTTEAPNPPVHEHITSADVWNSDDLAHWYTCTCGDKVNQADHTYGEWNVTKEATETAEGSRERICSVCAYKQVETVPVIGHVHNYASAWSKGSNSHWHECECGNKSSVDSHTYGSWTAAKEATCTAAGSQKRTCTVCGHEETKTVAAKGHTVVKDAAVAATCTKSGLTEGKHCSVCGKVTEKQTTVAAKGHTIVKDAAVAATCTKSGLTEGKHCSVCGTVTEKQATVAAKGHTIVNDAAVAATCSKSGLTAGKHCSVCGTVTVKQATVAATGKHTYVNGKCSRCGAAATPEKPVQDADALDKLLEGCISAEVTNVSTQGLELFSDGNAEYLFDGDTSYTKMGGSYSSTATITWKTGVRTTVRAYVIYTGNDSTLYGRTPLSWTFYGSSNGSSWTAIDTVYNSGMFDADSKPFGYYVDNPKGYTYYKLEITSTTADEIWENGIQMNEIVLIGNGTHSYANGKCSKCGELLPASVGLDYQLQSNDTYTVTGIGSCTDTKVTIPYTYNGKAVTAIGSSAFNGCNRLTEISIPDSVTSIGERAFYSCSALKSINLPDSVNSIGASAFGQCSSLTAIAIPNGVTGIETGTFSICSSLTSITIPDSVTRIGDSAFNNCSSLKSITIPSSVTSIGNTAFWNCIGLKSITIPAGVTAIGRRAFYQCSNLNSVTFQNTSGWYVTDTAGASRGTRVSVYNASNVASYLKDTYRDYYWYTN